MNLETGFLTSLGKIQNPLREKKCHEASTNVMMRKGGKSCRGKISVKSHVSFTISRIDVSRIYFPLYSSSLPVLQ